MTMIHSPDHQDGAAFPCCRRGCGFQRRAACASVKTSLRPCRLRRHRGRCPATTEWLATHQRAGDHAARATCSFRGEAKSSCGATPPFHRPVTTSTPGVCGPTCFCTVTPRALALVTCRQTMTMPPTSSCRLPCPLATATALRSMFVGMTWECGITSGWCCLEVTVLSRHLVRCYVMTCQTCSVFEPAPDH